MNRLPLLVFLVLTTGSVRGAGPGESVEGIAFFEKRIRPILVEHCYRCHSTEGKKAKGGLVLDAADALRKGGKSGPALVAGEPEKSLLVKAVRHGDAELKMPPDKKLSATQIDDLIAWVKMGAPDPRLAHRAVQAAPGGPVRPVYGMSLEEGRRFWSFLPVKDPPLPTVTNRDWGRNPIDNFILARLEQAGLQPSAPADRRTLLRRVTFDLTGLPPTPAEAEAFLADTSPNAFERIVDRLLASPRYGERWGRHWLDVVRYADTCGNASDYPVPQAHLYRDWVVHAFNRDLPYDQFLREQVAGDLLGGVMAEERYERIIATGYLAIARRFGGNRTGEHHLTLEDTIDNLGRAILGHSLSCARCHDHKFDPFTMKDYYALYGIFSSTRYPFPGAEVGHKQEDFVPLLPAAEVERLQRVRREEVAAVEAEMKRLQAAEAEARKAPERPEKKAAVEKASRAVAEANQRLAAVRNRAPAFPTAYAVGEAKAVPARIHLRGDPTQLGEEVRRGFPAVLGGQTLPAGAAGSGRLELAQWVTDPKNPLPARVMVNRLWQHHFGKGIVRTPNDFGKQGQPPTHPELLDYLAVRFIESGWSIKAMHRLILLSQTWQQAGTESHAAEKDANNDLYGRFTRRRLDAEAIRDALLVVSGELDETRPEAHPFPAPATWGFTQHNPFAAVYETRHRSLYLMQQRLRKHPYLALFDGADPSTATGTRLVSTTPLQALFLMNDPLAHSAATKLAARVLASSTEESARLEFAFQLVLTRPPEREDRDAAQDFLRRYREKLTALRTPSDQIELKAWSALARALLSTNEFVFVD
jgi:hypothetical protein